VLDHYRDIGTFHKGLRIVHLSVKCSKSSAERDGRINLCAI